jgi:hypothetical protein
MKGAGAVGGGGGGGGAAAAHPTRKAPRAPPGRRPPTPPGQQPHSAGVEDLGELSVMQLRKRLAALGLSEVGCVRKADFVALLEQHRSLPPASTGYA